MEKFIILFIATIISSSIGRTVSGQSFSHAVGAGFISGDQGTGPGFVYSPRINMVKFGEASTISVGTHIGLAAKSGDSGSGGGSVQEFIGIDAPLMLEFNYGAYSYPKSESNFGVFGGIGYGFSSFSTLGPEETFTKGVFFNLGLRFADGLGGRVSYMENFEPEVFGSASLTVQYNLR